ncbi:hypothetical protein GWI33_011521 [Rhynchophorus ferrugineus]|uniref:Uncharacterized protein n=1 Tax=Rhynchophorus ferrugineus TaxID=354439 RepID=A0A834ICN7_RHYFE|nr:hypothetical protein GWI33_011521 [Rhynchophorus ferrugineus]
MPPPRVPSRPCRTAAAAAVLPTFLPSEPAETPVTQPMFIGRHLGRRVALDGLTAAVFSESDGEVSFPIAGRPRACVCVGFSSIATEINLYGDRSFVNSYQLSVNVIRTGGIYCEKLVTYLLFSVLSIVHLFFQQIS